ncbi:hypothetical protein OG819_19785 [Streptomyces sp. NBC_01549]|uniref:hypothetical protein n=1 Tax=Streptomyces sp. NBC_01549 TaxID=2975874 RepID=UPI00225644D8|nr:hypothetical protein [Streptomyces sp. NBC_01549]MCX4591890.1 hypothetical protein [Streptomyces sp. NBC_01549]
MPDFIARLFESLLRFLFPTGRRRRRTSAPRAYTDSYTEDSYPYSCQYVGGPTVYRRGERPLRGEDSPLVRPYLLAHERAHLAAVAT